MATYHIDFVNGNDANDGSTWALAKKTITNATTYDAGSFVKIAKSPDIIASGINAAFEFNSRFITLPTLTTLDVEKATGNTWTVVANVIASTAALSYSKFENTTTGVCQRFQISANFTTGKVIYKALPTTLDLSSFSKISLWLGTSNITGGLNTADKLRLCLCSDTNGDVVVNTLSFPAINSINSINPFELDNGSPLGNNINSIAFYMNGEPGTPIVWFTNIFATNIISLKTLIGKADKEFYAIRNIVNNVIEIDSAAGYNNTGYYNGTTETAELYYRNAIQYYLQYTSYYVMQIKLGVESNSLLTEFQFGWNTITDEQDGETCIDGLNNFGIALGFVQYGKVKVKNLHVYRFTTGLTHDQAKRGIYEDCIFCACTNNILLPVNAHLQRFINVKSYCAATSNLTVDSSRNEFINCIIGRNGYLPGGLNLTLNSSSRNNYFKNVIFGPALNYNAFADLKGDGHIFEECEFKEPSMPISTKADGTLKFINCIIPYLTSGVVPEAYGALEHTHELSFTNLDNIIGNNFVYGSNFVLRLQTEIKPENEDNAWFIKTHNNYGNASELFPGTYKIAEIDVEANQEITIRLLAGVASVPNAAKIFIKKDITLGIDDDVYSNDYINNNYPVVFDYTSVTVTPTSSGVIELHIAFWFDVYFSKIEIV